MMQIVKSLRKIKNKYQKIKELWSSFGVGPLHTLHILLLTFFRLYSLAQNKDAVVADCMSWNDAIFQWDIIFHRALQDWELAIFAEFLTLLYSVNHHRDDADTIGWRLSQDRIFTVKSFYKILHSWGFFFLSLEKHLEG